MIRRLLHQRGLLVMLFIWAQRSWLCHLYCPITSPTGGDLLHWGSIKLCPGFCAALVCSGFALLALQLWWGHVVPERAALQESAMQKVAASSSCQRHVMQDAVLRVVSVYYRKAGPRALHKRQQHVRQAAGLHAVFTSCRTQGSVHC